MNGFALSNWRKLSTKSARFICILKQFNPKFFWWRIRWVIFDLASWDWKAKEVAEATEVFEATANKKRMELWSKIKNKKLLWSFWDGTMFRQIVGSLRFICHSRPEVAFSVGLVSRFMSDPRQPHLIAAKRIMRYLRGTLRYGILFPHHTKGDDSLHLVAYSDSDWCGDLVDRRSTMGQVHLLSGSPIS